MTIRQAVERMWEGRCTIAVRREAKDETTGAVRFMTEVIAQDLPCRISYRTAPSASIAEPTREHRSMGGAQVGRKIKLILAPELVIEPGSRITVTQNGRTEDYGASGAPAVYHYHQELRLDGWKQWA